MRAPRSEPELIARIARAASITPAKGLVLGIGDDCAVYRPGGAAEDLVFTTDMLIEDVHFRRETHRATQVGHKALARGLSDIAAMGATPRFCLLSLALAGWTGRRWIDGFYRGLLDLARESRTALAGGDLARADRVSCDIVVCGAVPKGTALRRDGASHGDLIYVSGMLGGSALGLATGKGRAWKRHLSPQPRLALGRFLREKLRATACMDLSDGLSLDLHRLCLASGVSAGITLPPCFPGASPEQALHGGEDYELLFTLRPGTRVPAEFEGIAMTCIGEVRKGAAGDVRLDGRRLPAHGYDHFRRRTGRRPA